MECMDKTICDILDALRRADALDAKELDRILRKNSERLSDGRSRIAKKNVLPYYLSTKQNDPSRWKAWNVDADLEKRFVACVRMKPRRTASGVATITVITKPWPCSGCCIYCPNDIRMPKSYLHDEPACQRAERCWFDPYLQVASRLQVLELMGHTTDKVEMIVLGGNWLDYPKSYRLWFTSELFRALNDDDQTRSANVSSRRSVYENAGVASDQADIEAMANDLQRDVFDGRISYNDAVRALYGPDSAWAKLDIDQSASSERLERFQEENENSAHRMVGLVFETRPDSISAASLTELRELGCTKVQIGIQSLRSEILEEVDRRCGIDRSRDAISAIRLYGFKIHEHLMANLPGATPESDKAEFEQLMQDESLVPDELKLYPCSLIDGTGLMDLWESGEWRPYSEDELIDILSHDLACTRPFVRISRMVRDIGSQDIVTGNKKANLRQDVEYALEESGLRSCEIRHREIAKDAARFDELVLDDVMYSTNVSEEHFLQWIDGDYRIYGFLRLSLPDEPAMESIGPNAPISAGQAMIREVHVYGFAEAIGKQGGSAQHRGLGRKLIERSCMIAKERGYSAMNVISAVGTRGYYRSLGFKDRGLYQTKQL